MRPLPYARWLVCVVLGSLGCWAAAAAAPIPVEKALGLPGLAALLPPGAVAVSRGSAAGLPATATAMVGFVPAALRASAPVAIKAVAVRGNASGEPLRVAVLVLDRGPASARKARLILAKQQGKAMVRELAVEEVALGVHSLVLERVRPGGGTALAVHWASSPAGHGGIFQAWALGAGPPEVALKTVTEGFYFEPAQGGESGTGSTLVMYEPEESSSVCLPICYEWRGTKLVPARQGAAPLEKRLMAEYDEVLDAFKSSGAAAAPNRMVMDIALLRGRLLERQGRRDAARAAFEWAGGLKLPSGKEVSPEDRAELEERADEARRRAQALR